MSGTKKEQERLKAQAEREKKIEKVQGKVGEAKGAVVQAMKTKIGLDKRELDQLSAKSDALEGEAAKFAKVFGGKEAAKRYSPDKASEGTLAKLKGMISRKH